MKNVVHVKCNHDINVLTAKVFKVQFRFNTRLLAHNQRKVNFYRTRNRCIYLHMYTLITTQISIHLPRSASSLSLPRYQCNNNEHSETQMKLWNYIMPIVDKWRSCPFFFCWYFSTQLSFCFALLPSLTEVCYCYIKTSTCSMILSAA